MAKLINVPTGTLECQDKNNQGINMSKTFLVFVALTLTSLALADDMSVEEKIASAMSAAPDRISAEATIVDADGTVLRQGTNKWTCVPGGPAGSNKYPMCNDPVFVKWFAAVWDGKPFSTDVIGYSYMLAGGYVADINDPLADGSDENSIPDTEGPHLMLILPDGALREGLSADPADGDIFVLWKDTPMELVIIPLEDKQ